jgi:hypothetical protein
VTYFPPFQAERGVGHGVVVAARYGTDDTAACITNADSACVFHNLPPGEVEVEAYFDDGSPLYYFKCVGKEDVQGPSEYLLVQCKRVWTLWFPHLQAPPMSER